MTSLPTGIREKEMDAIEIVATNIKEATAKAATELGVAEGALSVTVLEETKGLFGKGQVRIRAEVSQEPAKAEKPKAEKKLRVAKKPAPEKEVVSNMAVVETEEPATSQKSEIVATEDDAKQVIDILNQLLENSGLTVSAEVAEIKGKYVNLSLEGRDVSYLVGRRGEVLNALQYMMNIIISRQLDSGVRAVIDGDNFRRRREEVLEKLALDIATEVKKRGEEAVLDALPAFERRVIHQALQEIEGITTYSEGEEPDRRVVIAPAEVA